MENIFESAEYLNGQSFGHGLSLFSGEGADDDFTPDSSLSLVVDKTGRVNVSSAGIQLWTADGSQVDCIDAGPAVPTFKPGNKFIAGIAAVLPGVPVGGIILFGTGGFTAPPIPAGWGLCDGSAYRVGARPLFSTPVLVWSGPPVPIIKYIIKLPPGAVKVAGAIFPAT